MKKLFSNIVVVIVAYTIGTTIGIIFLLLKWVGKIKTVNPENFPEVKSRLIIVCNHPDLLDCMLEVFLIPALLFPHHFLHPLKFTPWFTPDKRNFTRKWYWWWLLPRAIPIIRGGKENNGAKEARKMLQVLAKAAIIVLFPEGGRTRNGDTFLYSPSSGRRMRPLKKSVGWLVLKTKAPVLTIWTEDVSWFKEPTKRLFSRPRWKRKITVKIGKPMQFSDSLEAMSPSQLTEVITSSLLRLADQE